MGKAGKLDLEMKEILRSFEQAEKDTSSLPLNPPPDDEFDRIWTRIQAERELIPDPVPAVKPRRCRINKIFAIGVAAAVLTVGGCFVAMGTKSYFYRDGRRVSNGVVYNNDSNALSVRDEEEAYAKIAQELGMQTLKLGYMPEEMYFQSVVIEDGYGKLQYKYKNSQVSFIQAKANSSTSMVHSSDTNVMDEVKNQALHLNFEIYGEAINGNGMRYETYFTYKGVYYHLFGELPKKEFEEMLKKIHL